MWVGPPTNIYGGNAKAVAVFGFGGRFFFSDLKDHVPARVLRQSTNSRMETWSAVGLRKVRACKCVNVRATRAKQLVSADQQQCGAVDVAVMVA